MLSHFSLFSGVGGDSRNRAGFSVVEEMRKKGL
jgi:hypothetical protein